MTYLSLYLSTLVYSMIDLSSVVCGGNFKQVNHVVWCIGYSTPGGLSWSDGFDDDGYDVKYGS